jgi:hypothetical protein
MSHRGRPLNGTKERKFADGANFLSYIWFCLIVLCDLIIIKRIAYVLQQHHELENPKPSMFKVDCQSDQNYATNNYS